MISAIITAGGSSSRFEGNNKLLFQIGDKFVIQHTVDKFLNITEIDEIIISSSVSIYDELSNLFSSFPKIKIVLGGENRQESVYNALKACSDAEYVLIHDGARPFISEEVILKTIKQVKQNKACIVAVKTVDTIKVVDENMCIKTTPNRAELWNAQTPQAFDYKLITNLHEKYKGHNYTDDSLLCENEGISVFIVEGEYSNKKITTIEDVKI